MKIKHRNRMGYLFIAPFFIVFVIFELYPIAYTFFLSLYKWDGLSDQIFVGFDNIKMILNDPVFWLALKNTIRIWIVNFIPQIGIALLLAGIFTFHKFKGKNLLRAVFYLPNLVTAASVGLLFNLLFQGDKSVVNTLFVNLGILGKPFKFFSSPMFSSMIASYIQWWMWFGYTLIILMAGMTSIDGATFEAAEIDGANQFQIFRSIVMPQIRPTMTYLMLTSIIGGMQLFDVPATLTDGMGSPDKSILTIAMYIFNQGFKNYNMGYASSLSVGLFVIILSLSLIYTAATRQKGEKAL